MDLNNDHKTMNQAQRDDFKTLWEHRKHDWQQQAEKTLPDDATLLRLAERAQQQAPLQPVVAVPFKRSRNRWIPYAAAASLVIGVSIIGLTRKSQPNPPMPRAEVVTVESQTIHFLCNNGCSPQDIMVLASKVIK